MIRSIKETPNKQTNNNNKRRKSILCPTKQNPELLDHLCAKQSIRCEITVDFQRCHFSCLLFAVGFSFVVSNQSHCAYLYLLNGKVFWCFLGFTYKMLGIAMVFLVEKISVLAKCPILREEVIKGCILLSDIPKWQIKPNPATGVAALKLICLPYSSVLP